MSAKESKDTSVIDVDNFDGDVIFVSPPQPKSVYTAERPVIESIDEDIAVTFSQAGLNLPHAREHCKFHVFTFGVRHNAQMPRRDYSNNRLFCEKCYCFVCDRLASECNLWTCGDLPHCNAFAKNATWERLRARSKESVTFSHFETLREKYPTVFSMCLSQADALTIKTAEELKRCEAEVLQIFDSAPCYCTCFCHYQKNLGLPLFCLRCKRYHHEQLRNWISNEERVNDKILLTTKTAIQNINRNLHFCDMDSACVILEGLTRTFFTLRLPWYEFIQDSMKQMNNSETVYNAITFSLKKTWVDVIVRPSLSIPLYQCVRDELTRLLLEVNKRQSCPLKYITIFRSLISVKRWRNPNLKQVLAGSSVWNTEDVDVAAARLDFMIEIDLRKNAINYLQGTRVKMLTDWQVPKEPLYGLPMNVINAQKNDQRMVEIPIFRLKWIKLNAENGSLDNAIRVSVIPYHEPLNTYPSGAASSRAPCPVNDFTLDDIKDILSVFRSMSFFNYTSKNIQSWLFLMHALQVNTSLRSEENMEWILETFCPDSIISSIPNGSNALDIRMCAYQTLEDLKNPEKVVYRVYLSKETNSYLGRSAERFVLEVMIAFTCTYFKDNFSVLIKLISILDEKRELWACESVFKSPKLADVTGWDYPIEMFMSKGSILPGGSNCIPKTFFESWFKNIQPSTASTLKAVNLLQMLINEQSSKEAGQEFPISLVSLFLDRVEVKHGAVGALETLIIKFIPLIKDPLVAQVLKKKIQRLYEDVTLTSEPEPKTKTKKIGTRSKQRDTKGDDDLMEWTWTLLDEVNQAMNGNQESDVTDDVRMSDLEVAIACSMNVGKECEVEIEGQGCEESRENLRNDNGNGFESETENMGNAKKKSGNDDSQKNVNEEETEVKIQENNKGGNKQSHEEEDIEIEEEGKSPEEDTDQDHTEDIFSALVHKGDFAELENVLNSSVSWEKRQKDFLSKITSMLPGLTPRMQRLFLRSCSDWFVTILYDHVFKHWQYIKFPDALLTCLSTINQSHPAIFRLVLFKTMNKAEETMINCRMVKERRSQIILWMVDLKKLCARLGTTDLWNKEFSRLLNGPVKKKKTIFSDLISCEELTRENSMEEPTVISD